jgi:uncharacterized integral membrane protein
MARAIAFFVVLAFIGLFALLNWPAFAATTPLSLGSTTVDAPLGLIMLGVVTFTAVLFTVWAVTMQAGALRDARRMTRDLQVQRDLADRAEASRFTELRNFIAAELAVVSQSSETARVATLGRLDRLQSEMRILLDQSANSLAASLGELEDRLEREQRVAVTDSVRNGSAAAPLRR